MKNGPYALSVDASNDTGLQKMNPVTVRIYDVNSGSVSQKLITPTATLVQKILLSQEC